MKGKHSSAKVHKKGIMSRVLSLALTLFLVTGIFNPLLNFQYNAAPSGDVVDIITSIKVTNKEVPSSQNPRWNWDVMEIRVGFAAPAGAINPGDYFYVDIPHSYFQRDVLDLSGDIDLPGPVTIGRWYLEDNPAENSYRLYAEFNGYAGPIVDGWITI